MNDSQDAYLPEMKHQGRLNDTECNAGPKQRVHGPDHIKGYMDQTTSKRTPTHLVTLKWCGSLEPSTFILPDTITMVTSDLL